MRFSFHATRAIIVYSAVLVLLLTYFSVSASAQTPADAGSLKQQIEREHEKMQMAPGVTPDDTKVPRKKAAKGEAAVTVEKFHFKGNTLISDEALSAAVKDYLNRPLTFDELQAAAAAVGEAYRVKGWVVRSFLPKQDIVKGNVTIEIVEAKFGKTKIEGDKGSWLAPEKAQDMIAAQQPDGEVLSTEDLDRALLLLDDLPGVTAAGRLEQGAKDGETDLTVKLGSEPFATGMGIVDNAGSRATGVVRLHGNLQLISPFGVGDRTSAYLLHSEGLDYGQLEQTFPVGNDGLRIGFNGSLMNYLIVDDTFAALNGKGDSSSLGLLASYPLIRARQKNLYVDLNYDHRSFDNESGGATASDYKTDSVKLTLRGNIFDKLGGGGANSASLGAVFGDVDLGAVNGGEDPDLSGGFHKVTYNLARTQNLSPVLTFTASLSGQESSEKKLDSSEMFYLGGPSGVRAYPVSEAGGVSGQLLTGEFRWRAVPTVIISAFYDYGHVSNNGAIKSYSLKGPGLSLNWQPGFGLNMGATWAHRDGDNPNPTPTGKDQDGSLFKDRFWLTASYQF